MAFVQALDEKMALEFFQVLRELRTHLTEKEFLDIFREASARDQYELVGYLDEQGLKSVIGYRILFDLVHGRHLYIDDLVTTKSARSQGIGEKMLQHAEARARELGLARLRLSTGVDNDGGKKFYEKNGWDLRSVTYKKKI